MANPYHFVVGLWRAKRHNFPVKYYWEIISDNLSKAGWSWGCVATVDREGRTIWVVAAERSDAGRFVVHADETLTAFLELEAAISGRTADSMKNATSALLARRAQRR